LKTTANYDNIKDSTHLDKAMKVVEFSQNKTFAIQAKLFGVISSKSGYRPSWIEAGGPFKLIANFDQDNNMEFELSFPDGDVNGKNCQSKVKTKLLVVLLQIPVSNDPINAGKE